MNEEKMPSNNINYYSDIKCPKCESEKEVKMPNDACIHFYECENCKQLLKSLVDDCCVFCSYGSVVCSPKQKKENCC